MPALIPALVPSFIVEPVLRQARRFSRGSFASTASATPESAVDAAAAAAGPQRQPQQPQQQGQKPLGSAVVDNAILTCLADDDDHHIAVSTRAGDGLGLGSDSPPSSSPPNRPAPGALAAAPPQNRPLQQAPPPQSLPLVGTPPPPRGGPSDSENNSGAAPGSQAEETAAARLTMAEAQQLAGGDVVAVDAGRLSSPSEGELAGVSTGMMLPREYLRPEALPEDDGMGALRGRILEVQSRAIPAEDKAQLLHRLLMEGYARSRQQQQEKQRSSSSYSQLGATDGSAASDDLPPTVLYEQPLAQGPLESLKFWQLSLGEPSTPSRFLLTEDDLRPTYVPTHSPHGSRIFSGSNGSGSSGNISNQATEPVPPRNRHLGCEHYRRNVKLQCNACQKWYTCRLCHDDVEDHTLPRQETKNMLCMLCGYAQKASDECVKCGMLAARYYCGICKLWNDDPDGNTYHCNDCGICRVGAGLGKDFFHCKSCGICIAIETKDSHRCREGAMDCNCPICGEYMFTSTKRMIHMNPCRHLIHKRCYDQHMLTSYKCPICSKSTRNMESLFRKWDKNIEEQPMPPEWRSARAIIYCNDCEAKSQTLYHWVGLKCSICQGYNTREVQILNAPGSSPPSTSPALATLPSAAATETGLGTQLAVPSTTQTTATGAGAGTGIGATVSARDIAQPRRSVSHQPGASMGSHEDMRMALSTVPPERFARSLSPTPLFATNGAILEGGESDDDEDSEPVGEDLVDFDFWRRMGLRGTGTDRGELEDEDDEGSSEDEGEGGGRPEEDDDDDDDEEDDENEISLIGHR